MEGILDQIIKGELPEQATLAVVRGVFPLEIEDQLAALFHICEADEAMLEEARGTVAGYSEDVLKPFFQNRDQRGELLDFYLRRFLFPRSVTEVLLLNPAMPAVALAEVAPELEENVLDLVVNNQVKIQEHPPLVDALRRNPSLSVIHTQKLEEYERLLLKELVSTDEELAGKSAKEIEEEAIAEAKRFVEVFGKEKESVKSKVKKNAAEAKEKESKDQGNKEEAPRSESLKDIAGDAAKQKRPVLELIQEMSIPQKIQAAIKGDREYRGALIRDSNKLVCCAVIKSPRVTESEVEFYSNLRNVQTDVLRLIAQNREWIKNYKIVLNLVKNPRTPLAFSMKLMPRLNKADMRFLVRDKNVPEALRTLARRSIRTGK
ncbi:hypothetical protein [Acanthopleuribacter pedis]|uniref:Uncharacterized protein n=1 Tax=Acanthopleuribacter pedis TaxID=442870 RepID=A0A8J7U4P6_9BACT|nr:hypothetical protein [Acanthopleuribacter pedis]MBO1320009.1 hypothetical protein [Acanthopleuribacter pedis]